MNFQISSFFSLGGGCLKISLPLYKREKKIVRIIGFMVFKTTSSISRFQCKNRIWKICTESQDISKKLSKIGFPNQTSKIWHILADISGLGAYFSKPIFALKPWDWAGRFEYHEPYNPNDFFFSLIKGQRNFEAATPQAKKTRNLKNHVFSVFIHHGAIKYD